MPDFAVLHPDASGSGPAPGSSFVVPYTFTGQILVIPWSNEYGDEPSVIYPGVGGSSGNFSHRLWVGDAGHASGYYFGALSTCSVRSFAPGDTVNLVGWTGGGTSRGCIAVAVNDVFGVTFPGPDPPIWNDVDDNPALYSGADNRWILAKGSSAVVDADTGPLLDGYHQVVLVALNVSLVSGLTDMTLDPGHTLIQRYSSESGFNAWLSYRLVRGDHVVTLIEPGGVITTNPSAATNKHKGGVITALLNDKRQAHAGDDSYSTAVSTPLSVAAPGVLANDDLRGTTTPVSLDVATPPSYGSVVLADDGGFAYTPDHGYAGTDTFTYRITTPEATGNLATVSIAVGGAGSSVVSFDRIRFATDS